MSREGHAQDRKTDARGTEMGGAHPDLHELRRKRRQRYRERPRELDRDRLVPGQRPSYDLHAHRQNREASAPTVSEVVVTKDINRASPPLLEQARVGAVGRTVTLAATRTGKELETYMQHRFDRVFVSIYPLHVGATDAAVETCSLNSDKISWTAWPTNADGQSAEPVTVGYDIGQATRL